MLHKNPQAVEVQLRPSPFGGCPPTPDTLPSFLAEADDQAARFTAAFFKVCSLSFYLLHMLAPESLQYLVVLHFAADSFSLLGAMLELILSLSDSECQLKYLLSKIFLCHLEEVT